MPHQNGTILTPYGDRLRSWEIVFPGECPNVEAEWLTSLERALEELRKTRRPIADTDRAYVVSHVTDLLRALGEVDEWGAR
jgi:hypothetical protein